MKKYLYLVIGLGIVIWSIVATTWFYEDIIYLFERPESYIAQVSTIGTLVSWLFGIIYLWYGIKSYKINKLSNWSIIILFVSSLVSIVLMPFTCFSFGGSCPAYTQILNSLPDLVFFGGVILSFILLIISLFKKNSQNTNIFN